MGKYNLAGDRLTGARLANYAKRAITRCMSWPATFLPEGELKMTIRRALLKVQNSVSTELAVNKGDVVVQVGTPWPRTLRRFRKACGPTGRLIVFEAMSKNFQLLKAAVEEDGYDNVFVFYGAAWSTRESGSFLVSKYPGDHKIRQDHIAMDNDLREVNKAMEEIEVEFFPIDQVLSEQGISSINYLSVTVNGAELEVLKGAQETLMRSSDVRVYSKAHARNADGKPISVDIVPYLKSLGFKTMISKGEPSSTTDKRWRYRDGDVFAWKRH